MEQIVPAAGLVARYLINSWMNIIVPRIAQNHRCDGCSLSMSFGCSRSVPLCDRLSLLAAMPVSIDFGELGPEQEYLDRVINPQQEDDERPGSPVTGSNRAAADVPANERFPEGE
jgi:hypothetical protein